MLVLVKRLQTILECDVMLHQAKQRVQVQVGFGQSRLTGQYTCLRHQFGLYYLQTSDDCYPKLPEKMYLDWMPID